jgi:hypothetical protein
MMGREIYKCGYWRRISNAQEGVPGNLLGVENAVYFLQVGCTYLTVLGAVQSRCDALPCVFYLPKEVESVLVQPSFMQ